MHMRGSRQETRPLVGSPIRQILGLEIVSLLVIIVGFLVILAGFRVLPFSVQGFGLIGSGGQGYGRGEQNDSRRANQASHQWSLAGSLPPGPGHGPWVGAFKLCRRRR